MEESVRGRIVDYYKIRDAISKIEGLATLLASRESNTILNYLIFNVSLVSRKFIHGHALLYSALI